MGIVARFLRLCKADIHGVIDHLEDRNLLLKQYLRDMQEELGRKETRLRTMTASKSHLQHEHDRYAREIEKVEQDLAVAIDKHKDDIARLLIKKLKPVTFHCDQLRGHIDDTDREIIELQDCLEKQRLQYEQLQLRSKEYFHTIECAEWEKSVPATLPSSAFREPSAEEIELELLQRKEVARGGEEK